MGPKNGVFSPLETNSSGQSSIRGDDNVVEADLSDSRLERHLCDERTSLGDPFLYIGSHGNYQLLAVILHLISCLLSKAT
jgi:hypothetical protein